MALKKAKRSTGIPAGLGFGLLVSMAVTVVAAVVITFLVEAERIGESAIGVGTLGALLLGAIAGSITAAKRIKERRMIICLLSGAAYFVCLMCCTALFFEGQYEGVGMTALVIFGASAAVGLMGLKGKSKMHPRLRKMQIR